MDAVTPRTEALPDDADAAPASSPAPARPQPSAAHPAPEEQAAREARLSSANAAGG